MRKFFRIEIGLLLVVAMMTMSSLSVWQAAAQVESSKAKPMASLAEQLKEYHHDLGTEPTNARTDRVWRAVPGLAGWQLDTAKSERTTRQAADGRAHLVWTLVPPRITLAQLPPDAIYRGPSAEKSVSLMVNVSWGEEYVPMMLQVFRQAHVHATFFLDGKWVKANPKLVKAIRQGGHAIGSHGTGHPDFRHLTDAALIRQIDGTNAAIRNVAGGRVRLIAPPAGSYDKRLVTLARSRGMYTILWTADTVDWRRPPADTIVSRVKRGLTPGALILMHPTEPTVQALPQILRLISSAGYHTKTVEEVISERPAVHPPSVLSAVPTV